MMPQKVVSLATIAAFEHKILDLPNEVTSYTYEV